MSVRTTSGQLSWMFITRVIAQYTPSLGPIGSLTKKTRSLTGVKSRTANIQKLKLMDP